MTTLYMLGALQILFVVLFWIPRTAILGFLLMACYMTGAMAVHLASKEPLALQTGIEVAIWIAGFLRLPELSARLCGKHVC